MAINTPEDQYKAAGVDIGENERANELIKNLITDTFDDNVITDLEGLFSAGFRIDKSQT